MASLKDIRKRIDSVQKTQKTTSAMNMVSAAKLKRAENNIKSAIPYSEKLKEVVSSLRSRLTDEENPLFQEMGGEKTAVILITSDRGLCGGFNTNLCKKLLEEFSEIPVEHLAMTMIGRKGFDYFKRRSYEIRGNFQETRPEDQMNVVREVISQCIQRYENGELDKVYLAYNHYRSVINQKPVIEQLLPIPKTETENSDEREVTFEPSPEAILDRLLDKFLENRIYVSWLDSSAGEHAARMTSMDSATKNAGDMIDKLQLTYNRTRQAAITTELIEIISGAESI
ncbi:MAG: ATP synthase F1 subunit gamma [SAR324 cluster bacterium]|nr:ATP synthase F1 subunit gamma [SAR324 cluster bacterium]